MSKGLLVPYGSVMLPLGSGLLVAQLRFSSFNGDYSIWFNLASTSIFLVGFIEVFNAYDIISAARVPSVQRTKKVLRAGLSLIAIAFGLLIVPGLTNRAFSVEIPFHDLLGQIAQAIVFLSAFPLAGASLIVWDRWPSTGSDELIVPYWTRPSRRELVGPIGLIAALSSFLLIRFPVVALAVFSTGAVLFIVGGILHGKAKTLADGGTSVPLSRVELRKVDYEEKLATARKVCELIVRKLGRRVFAVCLWGDEKENSKGPYSGINLLVVVRDGVNLPWEHYVFDGLRVKIDYWQEIAILHRARSFDEGWPWESDSYRRRVVLYEKKGWLRKLDSTAEESDVADSKDAIRRSAVTFLRHMADTRDDQLAGDTVGVRVDCSSLVWSAIELVFLLNRRYIKNDYWKEVFECPVQPSDFRRRLEILLRFVPASQEDLAGSAESLCEELLEMVRSRGINIASSELQV